MLGSIATIQTVIASVKPKQSKGRRALASVDCLVALLLAMTVQLKLKSLFNAHAALSVLTMWIRVWLINSGVTDWQIDQPAQQSAINPERMEP
ncbi:hypothetical protein CYD53_115120 [Bosea psychrotolerans]|uniref:Uncharacterized protein n=2 Tax=Bosea psychrotolerans TaxID=1871628 RepID=A0A2S4M0X0_9HYPH|nr:hypothetical protein CYD53_115120 [Bosea psychrotolerans]